jgi:hypothetical protein
MLRNFIAISDPTHLGLTKIIIKKKKENWINPCKNILEQCHVKAPSPHESLLVVLSPL